MSYSYHPSYCERNTQPSALNTSAPTGAASQLASFAKDSPSFDGVTIEQMSGNPIYDTNVSSMDKVALAQKRVVENAKVVHSKRGMIRQLNDLATRVSKPTSARQK